MSISPAPPNPGSGSPSPYAPAPKAERSVVYDAREPKGPGLKIAILFGCVIALIGANVFLFYQLNKARNDWKTSKENLEAELSKLQDASNISAQTSRARIQGLQDRLEVERRQYRMAVGEAKNEALKKVEETRQQLQSAQVEAQKQVESHISEVRQSADTANTKVQQVGTEVTGVKTDLSATKSQVEKTIADLKKSAVDIDGHSVMIAKNGSELKALRELGERNYVEFNLNKTKSAQKVGDVLVRLEKADPKHNRYSIQLTADDKVTEKKDKTVNEPIVFVTSKSKQPYEIVVNDIKKDAIVGYLSIPKVLIAR
jgi:chromosome segregation ATPase